MADAGIQQTQPQGASLDEALSNLEALVTLASGDASRSASQRLQHIQKMLSYRMVETYDPQDRDGFAEVVTSLCAHVPDCTDLAGLFAISVSTLYRWRSGEAVPHKLVRAAVKEHLLGLLRHAQVRMH